MQSYIFTRGNSLLFQLNQIMDGNKHADQSYEDPCSCIIALYFATRGMIDYFILNIWSNVVVVRLVSWFHISIDDVINYQRKAQLCLPLPNIYSHKSGHYFHGLVWMKRKSHCCESGVRFPLGFIHLGFLFHNMPLPRFLIGLLSCNISSILLFNEHHPF